MRRRWPVVGSAVLVVVAVVGWLVVPGVPEVTDATVVDTRVSDTGGEGGEEPGSEGGSGSGGDGSGSEGGSGGGGLRVTDTSLATRGVGDEEAPRSARASEESGATTSTTELIGTIIMCEPLHYYRIFAAAVFVEEDFQGDLHKFGVEFADFGVSNLEEFKALGMDEAFERARRLDNERGPHCETYVDTSPATEAPAWFTDVPQQPRNLVVSDSWVLTWDPAGGGPESINYMVGIVCCDQSWHEVTTERRFDLSSYVTGRDGVEIRVLVRAGNAAGWGDYSGSIAITPGGTTTTATTGTTSASP